MDRIPATEFHLFKRTPGVLFTLLAFLALSANAGAAAPRGELDSVRLIQGSYHPPKDSGPGRLILAGLMEGISLGFGKPIQGVVKATLQEKFESSSDVQELFPSASERREVVNRIIDQVNSRYPNPNEVWTNQKFVNVMRIIGRGVVSEVVDRALSKYDVESVERRKAWATKILGPFESCAGKARTLLEASSCWSSTQDSLGSNVALALTYEVMQGQVLGGVKDVKTRDALLVDSDRKFRKCWLTGAELEDCVLGSVRSGVLSVSQMALDEKLAPKVGRAKLKQILSRKEIWPSYEACVQKASEGSAINECVDRLVITAGSAAVGEVVQAHPSVAEAIPSAAERRKFVASVDPEEGFARCMQQQRARNSRVDGILDTTPCELSIENRVTRAVLERMLPATVSQNLGSPSDPATKPIVAAGLETLDRCWSDTLTPGPRDACIRSAIIRVSEGVSKRVLEEKLPAKLQEKSPAMKGKLLATFSACLKKELPAEVLDSKKRDAKLDLCSGALRRETALPVAEYQIAEAFGSRLSPETMGRLVNVQVRTEFAKCLGAAPSDQRLGQCSIELTKSAANFAGRSIIPETLHAYFTQEKIELTKEHRKGFEKFLQENLTQLSVCFDRELTSDKVEEAGQIAEDCFKKNIRPIASYLAQLRFDLETAALYGNRRGKWLEIRRNLLSELDACAYEGLTKDLQIQAYIEYVEACGGQLALQASAVVGNDQVLSKLDEYLPELDPGARGAAERKAVREQLIQSVLGRYNACLRDVRPSVADDRTRCTESLQKEATVMIGGAVGRAKANQYLGKTLPPEVVRAETALKACVDKTPGGKTVGASLDGCMKQYAMDLANAVGPLKLRAALTEVLGAKGFAELSPKTERAIAEFGKCLNALKPLDFGDKFTAGIDACSEDLYARARGIVFVGVDKLLDHPVAGKNPRENALAALAQALPCLDRLTADRPVEELAQAGVDAPGMIEALAKLVKDYIDYDAQRADADVAVILKELNQDLAVLPPGEARKKLLDLLVARGALDQVLKSVVRGTVRDAFDSLPPADRIAEDVRRQLLEKETFEKIFGGEAGKGLNRKLVEGIVRPVLIEGKPTSDPAVDQAMTGLKQEIAENLIQSPHFGSILVASGVQREIDSMNGPTRAVAKMLYGKDALNWAEVRKTADGQAAEAYIRDNILRPKALGEKLTQSQEKERVAGAKKRVTQAVKSYRASAKKSRPAVG